ncbi:MAG: sulfatase [Bacteroidota bacterium]
MNLLNKLSILLLIGIAFACKQQETAKQIPTPKTNIIFIFSDDHATHAIGAYGSKANNPKLHEFVKTPNLDRLAKEGMLFKNCFVTNSICAPSRAVILTGKFSHQNGVVDNVTTFDGNQLTFPKVLQKAGYQTALVGKWHLKSDPQGFDFWKVLTRGLGQGTYYNPILTTADGQEEKTGYTSNIITEEAIKWLSTDRDSTQPFMLMYQHKAPHRRWLPGPDTYAMYKDIDLPEPDNLFDDFDSRASALLESEMTIADYLFTRDLKFTEPEGLTSEQSAMFHETYDAENKAFIDAKLQGKDSVRWKYQRYMKDYLRTVTAMDNSIGRLLNYLDESGLSENTIVVYSSDQGFYLGDHGMYDKRWMYEESLRMPLIARWPSVVEAGSVNTDLVQNLDFAKTFMDIADAEIPEEFSGESIVPLLKGETPDNWKKEVYYHYFAYPDWHMVRQHRGIRTDRYKLIHYHTIDEWELFDLEIDPNEMNSLYGNPEYDAIQKELKIKLDSLRKAVGDTTDIKPNSVRHI